MKKGDSFKTNFSKETYKIAGRWHEFFHPEPAGQRRRMPALHQGRIRRTLQRGEFIEEK